MEKLDIRFSRACRRLQRSIVAGITRICQIHLAAMNLDPDPRLFQVHMPETSMAEEESMMSSLSKSMDVTRKFMKMVHDVDPSSDKKALFDFMNQRLLKMEDFKMSDFSMHSMDDRKKEANEAKVEMLRNGKNPNKEKRMPLGMDLMAPLPLSEKRGLFEAKEKWEKDTEGDGRVVETGMEVVVPYVKLREFRNKKK
jgi:hypothetical protein